ncbi:MAG: single-stranded DNA-binding protein [Porphyromonadaceae bacterium]|nr:single-stranded DNA-binding protein [Porphyromonadaceae bacterium]
MINRVILIGRLTKAPELRKTQSGTSVVSYTLAVNRNIQKDGQPDADFIQCVAWNKTADLMEQYLHKGSLIGIEGRIQTRSYDNQQGQKTYVTEVMTESIQFLEPKSTTEPQQRYNAPQSRQYEQPSLTQQAEQQAFNDTLDIRSDDLPF